MKYYIEYTEGNTHLYLYYLKGMLEDDYFKYKAPGTRHKEYAIRCSLKIMRKWIISYSDKYKKDFNLVKNIHIIPYKQC